MTPDPLLLALGAALLLGARHATDPDHLTAVSTLVLGEPPGDVRRATLLGLCWGVGHAITLVACGLPVVLLGRHLPAAARLAAEALVGALVVALSVRLLLRWRRGYFHLHPHRHGEVVHVHPHFHETAAAGAGHPEEHRHSHARRLGRSPAAALGVGLVHGVGGSAAAALAAVASMPTAPGRLTALGLFAAATAAAMTAVSGGFAYALGRLPLRRRLERLVPAAGLTGLAFGLWYAWATLGG